MYRGKVLKGLIFLSVMGALFAITFYQRGSSATEWTLRLLWGVGILFTLVGPGRNAATVARWARDGLLANASVTECHLGKWYKHAEVRGRRVVHHPLKGDFSEEFAIVAPWAADVISSSTVTVLVAPDERETWGTLGPGDAGHLPRRMLNTLRAGSART